MKYITLLRGINVSGKNILKMADLRNALEKNGFESVETYIQSGNILLSDREKSGKEVAQDVHQLILSEFGIDVPVWVFTAVQFRKIAKNHTFETTIDLSKLHVTFLQTLPDPESIHQCNTHDFQPDLFSIQSDFIYVYCPNGYGRTKINNQFFEKKLQAPATTRNWKTVQKLAEMIQGG